MPIFEYRCTNCQKEFELLIRADELACCPTCGSGEPEKLLSISVAHSAGQQLPVTSACPPSDAPPCGPGCCRLG